MILKIRFLILILAGFVLISNPAFAENLAVDLESIKSLNIRNLTVQDNQVFTGGQPSPEQLKALSGLGIKHVINLRPTQEQNWNEADYVNSIGMQYYSIPVYGAQGITSANSRILSDILSRLNGEPVLLHCASGNRVGALIAVSSKEQGLDTEASITKGKEWGLTSHEQYVRSKLNAE